MPPRVSGAVRNSDGSVQATINGASVNLSASDLAALNSAAAAPVTRPLLITTGSGRQYGHTGTPRYGIWMDAITGQWHYLDKQGRVIPNTSWKARNLNRAKLKFNAGV